MGWKGWFKLDPIDTKFTLQLQAGNVLKTYIDEDYRAMGRCRVTLAKETFLNVLATIPLQKSNPYTERFNNAYIKLDNSSLNSFI